MIAAFTAVDLAALLLCILFLAYVVTILGPFLRRRPDPVGDASEFSWHLILPCLDEELVIERTVRRLRSEHPRAHLWCVDDNSADATGTVLERLARRDPKVHLVSRRPPEAQQGKGAALNSGWRAIRVWLRRYQPRHDPVRVIVGVVDADGRLAPDALDVVAGAGGFGDDRVGAVQIQVRMVNRGPAPPAPPGPSGTAGSALTTRRGRLLVTLQDLEFRTVIAAMQTLRHRLGSAGMGGNGQFSRLQVLNDIAATDEHATPWHGALLEDFELGLHVLLAGWANRYCDDTWVAQEGLPTLRPLIRQRARWAQGGMQCAKYLRRVLTSPAVRTASALEIVYFLMIPWTQLLGTLVYAAASGALVYWALVSPTGVAGWFLAGAWGLVPLVAVFGLGPLVLWGFVYRARCEPGISRRAALGLGLAYWVYTYLMLAAVWTGFARLLRARNGWAKTDRVAEASAPVPAERVPPLRPPARFVHPGPAPRSPRPRPVPTGVRVGGARDRTGHPVSLQGAQHRAP